MKNGNGRLRALLALMAVVASLLTTTAGASALQTETENAAQVDTDASIGTAGDTGIAGADGSTTEAATDLGPDQARIDAEANQAIEDAAAAEAALADGITAEPIVPQQQPRDLGIADGSEPDPLAAPAGETATPVATTVPEYATPDAGTSAVVELVDDPAAGDIDVESLSPHLRLELETAAQARFVDLDGSDLADTLTAENVTIELFEGVVAELHTTIAPSVGADATELYAAGGASAHQNESETQAQETEASTVSSAVVTIAGDDVVGQFWVDGKQYGIQPVGGGTHLVFEVAREFDNSSEPDDVPGPSNGPSGLTVQEQSGDGEADIIGVPAIDVMVAYDAEAFAFWNNDIDEVRLQVAAMVNLTNVIYRNSDNEQHLNLTHIYATGVTPNTNDIFTYRNQLAAKSDGNFDDVHTSRDSNASDLIVLISDRFVAAQSLCGVAFFPDGPNPAEDEAYNVTEASCGLSGMTFPHELGHNQCAGHDLDTPNACGYTDGTGHVDAGAGLRTVMARNSNTCCDRQPVFSNPDVTFDGWATGVTGVSDNHRVMEIEDLGGVSGGLANYRSPGSTQTSVAGVDGESCIFASLEDAFATAATGSTIYVAPGTYPAESSAVNYNIGRDFDIVQGTAQCEPTTGAVATDVVLQLATGSTSDAVVEVFGGANVRFERITIEGGNSAEGTVRTLDSGTNLTLDGSIIRNGDNPSTTLGGGGLRVDANTTVTMVNNGQIVNNTAINGGGVFVDGGTFTIADADDVENNSATHGGGIYADNDAVVNITANGDVLGNDATGDGGGVYLTGGADLVVADAFSHVGDTTAPNTASRGGGIFVDEVAGTTATLNDGAEVDGNEADYGAGVYLLGGEVTVNNGAMVQSNAGGNGGGILGTLTSVVDVNAGALIRDNSGALGAGLFIGGDADLQVDGNAVNPVLITGNDSTSNGGGLYLISTETATLDTVHFHSNSAVNGGGIYLTGTGEAVELSGCDGGALAFEEYCSEFRGNTADAGGAVYSSGGSFSADQTGFVENVATTGAQAIHAVGASDVDLTAVVVLGHDSLCCGDGTMTAADTTTFDITAATFADGAGAWFDNDGSATSTMHRVIADTNVLTPDQSSGACNLQADGATGMPGAVTADPQFTTTANSAYVPDAASPATDACTDHGVTIDVFDFGVKNGDGLASATEYDMGAIEADTGLGFACGGFPATIVGDNGANVITGTAGDDVIVTLGGADDVRAGAGNDVLCLGAGNDFGDGEAGDDLINGGGGRDIIEGGAGDDVLNGKKGNDVLRGQGGSDVLNGNAGNDTLRGQNRADVLNGGAGADTLFGNKGADDLNGNGGSDTLNGGLGSPDDCNGGGGIDTTTGGCEIIVSIP